MSDAAKRVRSSRRLRSRFAASYRGPHHPDDALDWLIEPGTASRRGTPPPVSRIDRTAPYQPGAAEPETRTVTEALRALDEDTREAERVVTEVMSSATSRRHRLTRIAVVAVAVVVLVTAVSGIVANRSARDDEAALERSIVASRGAVAPGVFFGRYPDRLDAVWRQAASATALDGATPVLVPDDGSRLLLVVACSAADRSFEYDVSRHGTRGGTRGYGACGSLRPAEVARPTGSGRLRILVIARGIDPFSISVYSRRATER